MCLTFPQLAAIFLPLFSELSLCKFQSIYQLKEEKAPPLAPKRIGTHYPYKTERKVVQMGHGLHLYTGDLTLSVQLQTVISIYILKY